MNDNRLIYSLVICAYQGSLDGLNGILLARRFWAWRLFYLTGLLLAFVTCGLLTYNSFEEYLINQPTETSLTYIAQNSLTFPDIYICPINSDHEKIFQYLLHFEFSKTAVYFMSLMSYNKMMSDVRQMIASGNLREMIDKYQYLENVYSTLVGRGSYSNSTKFSK